MGSQLGEPPPHWNKRSKRTPKNVDDLRVHIAHLLNTGSSSNLAVSVSGAFDDVKDLTLTIVTEDNPDDDDVNESRDECMFLNPYVEVLLAFNLVQALRRMGNVYGKPENLR